MILSGRRLGQDEHGARTRLVRRIAYVALGALLGLAGGIALSSRAPQRYESTMQLLVGPVGADRSTLDASGLLSRTYADLLTSRNAVNRAADSLGVTVEDGDVSAIADDKSRVILLVVQSDDPATPPRLATTLATDLIALVEGSFQEFDAATGARSDPGQVRVLDNATDPAIALSRVPILTLLGMVVVGAGVGLALGAIAPRTRGRPIDRQYLDLIGLKVISLEQVTSGPRRRFLSRRSAKRVANKRDEYELVFQQLLIACVQQGRFRSLLFVPVTKQVQADTARLMMLLAQAGQRLSCTVELADIDPEGPLLNDLPTLGTGIDIIKPIDLDSESGLRRIGRLTELSAEKLLFLATPAVGTSIRALTGAPAADRIVLVGRYGETGRGDISGLLDDLGKVNVKPVLMLELGRGELASTAVEDDLHAIGLLDVDARTSDSEPSDVDEVLLAGSNGDDDFDYLDDLLIGASEDDGDAPVEVDDFDDLLGADAEVDGEASVDVDDFDDLLTDDDEDSPGAEVHGEASGEVDEFVDHLTGGADEYVAFDDLDDLLADDDADGLDEDDEDIDDLDDGFVAVDEVDEDGESADDDEFVAFDEDDEFVAFDEDDADDADVDDLDEEFVDVDDLDEDEDEEDEELVALGELDEDEEEEDDDEFVDVDDLDEVDDLDDDESAEDDDFVAFDDLDDDGSEVDDSSDDDDLEDLFEDEADDLDDLDHDIDHGFMYLDDDEAELSADDEFGDDEALSDHPSGDSRRANGKTAKEAADDALASMRASGRWKR